MSKESLIKHTAMVYVKNTPLGALGGGGDGVVGIVMEGGIQQREKHEVVRGHLT